MGFCMVLRLLQEVLPRCCKEGFTTYQGVIKLRFSVPQRYATFENVGT